MIFHGHLHTDEPPGGDYVRYIESLVGGPPEDAEQAAAELALRLAGRRPMTQPLDLSTDQAPAAAGVLATGPALPAAIGRSVPSPRRLLSRLLIIAGAALIGLGFVAPGTVSMVPGILLLFAGFSIGGRADRKAARTRSGRP